MPIHVGSLTDSGFMSDDKVIPDSASRKSQVAVTQESLKSLD
jgi:hypothetical protein